MNIHNQTDTTKQRFSLALPLAGMLLATWSSKAFAQITNPALSEAVGGNAEAAADGSIFVSYLISIWQMLISVGGLMVLLYFVWGSIDWIVAGGDQSKIQKGRDRMIQAVIGMILLAGSFVLLSLINTLFFEGAFDLLDISF